MEYRNLGSSGLRISALSYGAWVTFGEQFGIELAESCMTAAYDAGVNFFDNAEAYAGGKAETIMGEVLRKTKWKRSDLVVSTKIFWGGSGPNDTGLSRKHILEGADAALRRLQLDYVDLIYCHRPDIRTPIQETVRAMSHLVDRGKALYWGTSEWSAEQIRTAYEFARREHLVPPTMEQPQYNMLVRERVEREYAPLYRDFGLGTTTFSPLASGLLTGKYNDGIPEGSRLALEGYGWLRDRRDSDEGQSNLDKVRRLADVATKLGCTQAQMSLAWCLLNPNVSSVITGASRPEQVAENLKALDVVEQLVPDIVTEIEAILDNRPPAENDFRS